MLVSIAATGREVSQGWMTCHHGVKSRDLWERFLLKWAQGSGEETTATAFFSGKQQGLFCGNARANSEQGIPLGKVRYRTFKSVQTLAMVANLKIVAGGES